jgi:hypothetical protein
VKRSGRDESIWVAIHMCMITILGISLYSYLYLKLANTLHFSNYLLCSLFNKIGEQEGRTVSAQKWVGGGFQGWEGVLAQIIYTHVSNKKKFPI